MSTWQIILSVWAFLAICALLFVRGASDRRADSILEVTNDEEQLDCA